MGFSNRCARPGTCVLIIPLSTISGECDMGNIVIGNVLILILML